MHYNLFWHAKERSNVILFLIVFAISKSVYTLLFLINLNDNETVNTITTTEANHNTRFVIEMAFQNAIKR